MNHPIYSAPSTHLPWVTSTVIHQKQRTATKMLKTKLKYSTIRKFRNSALMRMLTFCPKWWKPLLLMRRKIKSIRLIGSYPFGRRWVWKRVWMLSFKIKIVTQRQADQLKQADSWWNVQGTIPEQAELKNASFWIVYSGRHKHPQHFIKQPQYRNDFR